MKNIIYKLYLLPILLSLIISSCKKSVEQRSPLSAGPTNVSVQANGSNLQLAWSKPADEIDFYTVQVSKFANFSVLEVSARVDANEQQHVFRGKHLGEEYYVRIRAERNDPQSFSDWVSVQSTALTSNILLPILRTNINGNTVTVKWELPVSHENSKDVTKITVLPAFGPAREINLTEKNKQEKTLVIDGLEKDMAYTVRIYNIALLRGSQTFITTAEAVNGVWTLSPHSDLKAAIEASKSGDKIVLKAGIYNFWNEEILVDGKLLTVESAEANIKPKLYVKSFVLTGTGAGLTFKSLDVSGSRINAFKNEIPNTADTRWNSWLVKVEVGATNFKQLVFDDCIIRNYYTGVLNMLEGQTGDLVSINNSIVHHIGQDQSEAMLKTGTARIIKGVFTNSTYHITNKMFIAIDREKNLANDIDFLFKNNTVNQSWQLVAFDFKASKKPTIARIENNLFSNINTAGNFFGNFAQLANDFDKRLINCNFFNVLSKSTIYGKNTANMPVASWELRHPNNKWNEVLPAFVMNDATNENPNSIKEYVGAFDPQYADAANMNFKIGASSLLRNFAAGTTIGDPRWW